MKSSRLNTALLGDSPNRIYTTKLDLFNRFAEPELRQVIAHLTLYETDRILDAGCGTGLITEWLAEYTPKGLTLGVDLSTGHLRHARASMLSGHAADAFVQADMVNLPFKSGTFDLIWSSNAINHLRQPLKGVRYLATLLRPGGRLVLGQSTFLPEMFFAWDARLEKAVMLACRQYYRDKYALDERDTTHVRNLFGWLQATGFKQVTTKTLVIERTAPLTPEDEAYFIEAVFKGYWGHRVQSYLSPEDWAELSRLCDPSSPAFAPQRPDFHHVQTFTVVTGRV